MATFGERLKRIREQRGWSPSELAERSGVPYETIYRVERGTHQEPRVSIAAKLARALGVSLDVLAGVYDEESELLAAAVALVGT
jgi:transcriptional regulator with XRE-family HTH domain